MSDDKSDQFPFPLNVDIEEQIPVKKVKFDPVSKKTFSIYELEKVKTRYIDVPKEHLRCPDGAHIFKCVDSGKYIFSCINCPYTRKIYPSSYSFINGKLISKATKKVV